MIRPGTCIEEQCLTASVPMFLSNARNHSAIAWQPNKSQQVLAVLGYRVSQSLASANDALPSPEIETQRSLPLGTTRGGEKSEKTKDHHRSSQIITDPKNAMRALWYLNCMESATKEQLGCVRVNVLRGQLDAGTPGNGTGSDWKLERKQFLNGSWPTFSPCHWWKKQQTVTMFLVVTKALSKFGVIQNFDKIET